jgi:hypothetical protein
VTGYFIPDDKKVLKEIFTQLTDDKESIVKGE